MKLSLAGNLWRHRDFRRFWFSDTLSQFVAQFSGLALPVLAVLSLNSTPLDIGIINALGVGAPIYSVKAPGEDERHHAGG